MVLFEAFSLLEIFALVFVFIFVWAVVYAIFKSKLGQAFGVSDSLVALISFGIALIFVFVKPFVRMFMMIIPAFTIFLIIIVLILLLITALGFSSSDILEWAKKTKYVQYGIVIVAIVIVIAIATTVFGPSLLKLRYGTSGSANTGGLSIEPSLPASNTSTEIGESSNAIVSFEQNLIKIIFHPKVLGVLFLAVVSFFMIKLLSSPPK